MDEDFLSWLLLIPGVGRRRAERLAARFPTPGALREASVEDIAAVDGIGASLAERVKEFIAKAEGPVDYWYRGEPDLYLCPECGSMIARDARECPSCHAVFEGEASIGEGKQPTEEPVDRLERAGQSLNLCPECGAFVGADATLCPSCGTALGGEAVEGAEAAGPAPVDRLRPEGQGLYM